MLLPDDARARGAHTTARPGRDGTPARSRRLSAALAAGEWFPVRRSLALALDLVHEITALERAGQLHLGIEPRVVELLPSGGARLHPALRAATPSRDPAGPWRGIDPYAAHYLAPEQVAGGLALDIRADLYALGSVLFHMLSGAPAYAAHSASALARIQREGRTPAICVWREELPAPLAEAVGCCLASDRARRYPGTGPLMDALMAAAATLRRM